MFWIGMAVGMIVAVVFGMTLLVIVSREKNDNAGMNEDLRRFWYASLANQEKQIAAITALGRKSISLERLKTVIDWHFAPPFLPTGMVTAQFVDSGDLEIRIGARDVWLNKDGEVTAAGTQLDNNGNVAGVPVGITEQG